MIEVQKIIEIFEENADSQAVQGMARFGIDPKNRYGLPMPFLRGLAKKVGKNHSLALELWETEKQEARILACLIDEPLLVTKKQMDSWVLDFESWDLCDQCCSNLFDKTPFAHAKALEWSEQRPEFVKRAGFVMMACMAVHHKKLPDEVFTPFLLAVEREAADSRNFVKKAVNWALRQIGKRNVDLHRDSLLLATKLAASDNKTTRWIAKDALRELQSDQVTKRFRPKP